MNLTLLPTDIKFTDKGTDKSQPTLKNTVTDNHSSQFGQLLNAETAAMRKPALHAANNRLKEEKPTPDKTNWPPLTAESDKRVVTDKSQLETATAPQENCAEFAVLKDEDLLSAEALSAAIPVQLAGLLNPQAKSSILPENANGLMGNGRLENSLLENEGLKNPSPEETLLENEGLDSANSTVNSLLAGSAKKGSFTDTHFASEFKTHEPDESLQLASQQEIFPNNKTEGSADLPSALAPLAGQIKLATNNKAGIDNARPKNAASNNSNELNLPQIAIQATAALTTSTAETTSIDSPAVLAPSTPLAAGQPPAGQFQLNSTTMPLTTPLLNAHLGSEEWQQQLNQQVLFFNRNGLQQAELRLHPQELGALHIRMSVEDNQAQLHFMSAHQNIRAALEAALPGLRHALAENGIQLAQSSVNSDTQQGNGQQAHFANNPNRDPNSHAENQDPGLAPAISHTAAIKVTPQPLTTIRGGIDTFA
ncbi:flagellar hook-length control protein FliK [Xenorhabdus kozodoii]|uniref:Flagellar hook-length control protein n=1 Tax=Xenorhabdus kozodoii TaxID=351676 RepID=A0A2D0LDX1_9GAMM|nr:flagellar hook-length control protein [Xenorhabdus kozodoii]